MERDRVEVEGGCRTKLAMGERGEACRHHCMWGAERGWDDRHMMGERGKA